MYIRKYKIEEMDCPSEENLIRMKLQSVDGIRKLDFDLSKRTLDVYCEDAADAVTPALESLDLGARLLATSESDDIGEESADIQKRSLWIVLIINLSFFVLELLTGFVSDSMGLVADSLDMLSDGIVYGLSLFAVGATLSRKKRVAKYSGYFQMALALLGFAEVIKRVFGTDAIPDYKMMMIISCFALAANAICLYILQKTKSKEAHIRASIIFSSNDVFINAGVILAGAAVWLFNSKIPDLLIGSIVFVIVVGGAIRILKLAK